MKVVVKKFYPFNVKLKNATLLGYADVELDGKLLIRAVKLLKKPNGGIFVTMPSVKNEKGDYVPVVEIKDRTLREEIRKILSDYFKALNL